MSASPVTQDSTRVDASSLNHRKRTRQKIHLTVSAGEEATFLERANVTIVENMQPVHNEVTNSAFPTTEESSNSTEENRATRTQQSTVEIHVVDEEMIVSLSAGPWDALFTGGNIPTFVLAFIGALRSPRRESRNELKYVQSEVKMNEISCLKVRHVEHKIWKLKLSYITQKGKWIVVYKEVLVLATKFLYVGYAPTPMYTRMGVQKMGFLGQNRFEASELMRARPTCRHECSS
ncbi:hypothetical protein Tco_0847528 [Tanacetum coccineum]